MTEAMERRARHARARAAVRAWEWRQRAHAKGVWYRLRRVLADAESAWVVPEEEAAELVAQGFRPEAVGAELEPPKRILFVPPARLSGVGAKRSIAVAIGPEFLAARAIVLVRFG